MNDHLGEYRFHVDVQFAHLMDALFHVERLFAQDGKRRRARLAKESRKLTPGKRKQYLEEYADDFWITETLLPSRIVSAILISGYSIFEYELIRICKTIAASNRFRISLNDLRGTGVFLAQAYLTKVAEIDFPDKEAAWHDIVALNVIRNMIVHNNQQFDTAHPKAKYVRDYVTRNKDLIEIDNDGYFQVSYSYAEGVLHLMQKWYEKLFSNSKLQEMLSNQTL